MDPNRPQRFAFPVNNYLPSFTHLSHPLFREFMSEFVSTFLFIIVGIGCVITFKTTHNDFDTFLSLNLCWGFAVVFGGGLGIGVSGGHMNPAITLAQYVLGRKTWVQVLVYTPAQLLGTFAATACAYSDYTSIIDQFDGGHRTAKGNFSTLCFFVTCPNDWETNQLAGCWDQIIATGILGLVMASHIDPRNGVPRWMHPVLGGLSVMMIGMSFGMNDGYPINPARDLGARCFAAILYGKDAFTDRNYWFWVPIVGPTVGAVVGAWLYNLCVDLHSPKPEEPEDDPTKNGFLRQNGIEEKWETVRGPNDEVRKDLSTDF